MDNCPVCNSRLSGQQSLGWGTGLNCQRCGLIATFGPDVIAERELNIRLGPMSNATARHRRSRLSHILRRQQREGIYAGIPPDELDIWGLENSLPSAIAQADSLILFVGDRQESPGQRAEVPIDEVAAWIGDAITA